jgi:hypothetical protein
MTRSKPAANFLLQRKCDCGAATASTSGICAECDARRLQTKLTVGEPDDVYEQEADRVAQTIFQSPRPAANAKPPAISPIVQRSGEQGARSGCGVPPSVDAVLSSSGQPLDVATRSFFEPRFRHDFSLVRVHTDTKAAESARAVNALAYTLGRDVVFGTGQYDPVTATGKRLLAHELTHVIQQESTGASSPQRKEGDKNTPKAATPGPCGGNSLASSIGPSEKRLNGKAMEPTLDADDFGNTSKLGADFKFGACKIGTAWRFQLDALVIPIASKVQAATFRTNVGAASDSVVTKESYLDIVRDLSPTKTATFSVSCGGKSFEDKVTAYSKRKTYWNHQFVIDHEAFHRKDWTDMYRTELVKAESDVWAHSLPASEAADTATAIAKADVDLTKYMTDAYQRLCVAFAPKKESRAYDAGAPAYQKLVDDINARAKKEKW